MRHSPDPTSPDHTNPDHEALAKLAHDDPVAFETLRREMIDEMIGRAPEPIQRRLNGLQFRIDQVRQLAHTPLGAAIRISELMWKNFLLLNSELSGIKNRNPPAETRHNAQIINFRPRALPDC